MRDGLSDHLLLGLRSLKRDPEINKARLGQPCPNNSPLH